MTQASKPLFRRVDLSVDREAVFQLTVEYMSWVTRGIEAHLKPDAAAQMGSVETYVERTLTPMCSVAPPEGVFYLVELEDGLVGMCGLRRIAPRVAEFKRVYARPAYRGRGLGEVMLQQLLCDAKAFGHDKVVLDTAPFMHAAQRLYAALGFTECPPYAGTEVPPSWHGAWRFMARAL